MMRIHDGDVRKIKDMIEEAEQTLEKLTDVDPTVNAAVNWVASQMYKITQDFTNFYKSTLRYLSYISVRFASPSPPCALKAVLSFDSREREF